MYPIIKREQLNSTVVRMDVEAPLVAKKAKAGQFIILRVDSRGERIPLTVADTDPQAGTVTVIFQTVGATTDALARKQVGEYIHDFVGPLGRPTEIQGFSKVCVVGGGVGCAIALPIVKALSEAGCEVHAIIGFRTHDLVILEEDFRRYAAQLTVMTDDGSYGERGLVTAPLQAAIEAGAGFDRVIAIGPLPMMKFVCLTTKPYGIDTVVSMNPIMIDGTGMCGGCRLTVGGKIRFACVDGPEFNGHEVDFDEAMQRSGMYREFERHAREVSCNLFKGEEN